MADRDRAGRLVDQEGRDDRSHAGGRRIVEGVTVDPVVRFAQQLGERRLTCASGRRSSSAAAASREAISPACAPPTPSATAKRGGSQTNVSSFCGRLRPVSVSALARPVLTPAPADRSGRCGRCRPRSSSRAVVTRAPLTNVPFVDPTSSTQRPSGRGSSIACRVERSRRRRAGSRSRLRGRAVSASCSSTVFPAGAQGCRARACGRPGLCDDRLVAGAELVRLRRAQDDRLLRRRPEIARDRSHDGPDEEVEEHEEADLQREQRLLGVESPDHVTGSVRPKTTSVAPIVMRSPSASFSRVMRRPFSSVPFVEPRSTTQVRRPLLDDLGVAARGVAVRDAQIAFTGAADHDAARGDRVACAPRASASPPRAPVRGPARPRAPRAAGPAAGRSSSRTAPIGGGADAGTGIGAGTGDRGDRDAPARLGRRGAAPGATATPPPAGRPASRCRTRRRRGRRRLRIAPAAASGARTPRAGHAR